MEIFCDFALNVFRQIIYKAFGCVFLASTIKDLIAIGRSSEGEQSQDEIPYCSHPNKGCQKAATLLDPINTQSRLCFFSFVKSCIRLQDSCLSTPKTPCTQKTITNRVKKKHSNLRRFLTFCFTFMISLSFIPIVLDIPCYLPLSIRPSRSTIISIHCFTRCWIKK